MTTIAWDGKSLAADTQSTSGVTPYYLQKIFPFIDRWGKRFLIGASGDGPACVMLLRWYREGADWEDYPRTHKKSRLSGCLISANQEGEAMIYTESPYPSVFKDQFYAIGSGGDFAKAAMHLGKSAMEAVRLSAELDVWTGGSITVLDFSDDCFADEMRRYEAEKEENRKTIEENEEKFRRLYQSSPSHFSPNLPEPNFSALYPSSSCPPVPPSLFS